MAVEVRYMPTPETLARRRTYTDPGTSRPWHGEVRCACGTLLYACACPVFPGGSKPQAVQTLPCCSRPTRARAAGAPTPTTTEEVRS
jgi:hypothetical protein